MPARLLALSALLAVWFGALGHGLPIAPQPDLVRDGVSAPAHVAAAQVRAAIPASPAPRPRSSGRSFPVGAIPWEPLALPAMLLTALFVFRRLKSL